MKRIRNTFFYSVLLLLYFTPTHAQRDFRPGYIISNENDTIHGYLLYSDKKIFTVCTFRENPDSEVIHYYPMEIKAFRFNEGKYYISKEIPYNEDKKKFFAEYLIKGAVSVYFVNDGDEHYYIETEKNGLIELTEKKTYIEHANGNKYVKPSLYRGKLKSVMSDCPDIYQDIDRVSLNHSSLVNLAKTYHEHVCTTEQCIIFKRDIKPAVFKYSIYGGISLNNFTLGNNVFLNDCFGQLLGFRIEIQNFIDYSEHLSILSEMSVNRFSNCIVTAEDRHSAIEYKNISYYINPVGYEDTLSLKVNLKAFALKIPIVFKYTMSNYKFSPTIGIGLNNMFIISQNEEFRYNYFIYEYGKSIPTYHAGIFTEIGIEYPFSDDHSLFMEINWEYTQSFNVNQLFRVKNSLFSVRTGYTF